MKGLIIASMILLLSVIAFSQDAGFEASTPQLLGSEFTLLNERDYTMVADYAFVFSDLRLRENFISDPKKLAVEMNARLRSLQKCGSPRPMFYKDRNVGSLYWCSKESSRVLLYSYGEKIYEIASTSEDIINRFTKAVLPLSCQVHGAKDCISMFY
ncbi:MAG: hypothetical protein DMF63_14890 [Acidobacteria bacterium]|nr:MAG: hypothetical protein DMF63_14890 [Acidobacteriota bacterium]